MENSEWNERMRSAGLKLINRDDRKKCDKSEKL